MANGGFGLDGVEEAGIASVGDTVAVTVEIAFQYDLFFVPLVTQIQIVIKTERSIMLRDAIYLCGRSDRYDKLAFQ